MKKTAIMLVALLLIGCVQIQKQQSELTQYGTEQITYGQTVEEDRDGDGTTDRITYAMPREEIEENIFLQKTMTYDIDGDMMNGTLVLYFENAGDDDKTITYVEDIPKSFASHVDQLRFNIPPTQVLEEDPKVSWEQRILNRNNIGIVIQAGAEKIKSAALEKLGDWLGTSYTPQKDETAEAAATEKFADLGFDGLMLKADKMPAGPQRDNLRIKIMEKYPEKFLPDDCVGLTGVFQQVCLAVTTEDSLECDKIRSQEDREACKKMMYNSLVNKRCKGIQQQIMKDLCIHKAAVTADYAAGCQDIADPEKLYGKELCLAEVTQEGTWCAKITEERTKEACCEKIRDEQRRLECMGETLEVTPEELRGTKNNKYTFTARSYAAPKNPKYMWSFGGTVVETTEPKVEYTFAEADTYEIIVELVDGDTGQVVDRGYATAVITEPSYVPQTDYEVLLTTNKLSANMYVYGRKYEIREGQRRDYDDTNSAGCNTVHANLTWNGRLFSGTHTYEVTEPDGRKVQHKMTIEGAIAENQTLLEWFTCQNEWVDMERKELYSDTYVAKFQVKDLELKRGGFMYRPNFVGYVSGPEVRFYVNYGPEIHQEATRGSDKTYTYHSFTEIYWSSDYKTPTLSVTFSKE